jgi:hypothetical protein
MSEERPQWMVDLDARYAATKARIAERVAGEIAERNERIAALAWCRANGNPHKEPAHDPA